MSPTYPGLRALLGAVLLKRGERELALAEIEREPDEEARELALTRAYQLLGRNADANAALAHFETTRAANSAYYIAGIHALRGEVDQAFQWLESAYQQRDPELLGVPGISTDPDLGNLHGDPRYKALLRKLKLPE